MLNEKTQISRFHQVKNSQTGEMQWQCVAKGRFGQKRQRIVYVAKLGVPDGMKEGFYIFQQEEGLFIKNNWKLAVFAARIIAPAPWPSEGRISLSRLPCKKRGELATEWGFELHDGPYRIRYVVGRIDEPWVSAEKSLWFAEIDHVVFISPGGHFIVIRLKLLQLQNNPAEFPFAVM